MFPVKRDPPQRLARRPEQDVVNDSLVLKRDRRQTLGQGEHHVKVRRRQKLRALLVQPLGFRQRLTLRAMAVAARVVRHTRVPAPIARVSVPAQLRRAALLDRRHHPALWS
jgi:hypothetical protein